VKHSRRAEWILFAVATAIRLLHVFAIRDTVWFQYPIIDAATYHDAAVSIAAGHGHPDRVFWQPPGYSYFLGAVYAMTGGSDLIARLIQCALGGVAAVLTARIGALAFGRGVGLAAGYAAAAYGTLVYFDGTLLTPALGVPLLLLAIWLALRAERERAAPRLWAAAGFFTGVAALVTANALVLAPLFAWRARARWWIVAVSALLAVLPATLRNATHGGEAVLLSSNMGINLYVGNNPHYDETVGVRPDLQWRHLTAEPRRVGIRDAAGGSAFFVRRVLQYAASDPAGFLLLQAKKLRLLLGGNEIYRNQAIYPERASSPILAALLWKIPGLAFPFGILLPIAAVGLAIGARRAPLLAGSIAIYALSIVAFFIAARYRAPLVPLLLVFAAEGGRWLWKDATARQRLLALVGMAAVYSIANLGQGRMESRMNADAEYSVGVRLALAGHPVDARDRFRRALRRATGTWRTLDVRSFAPWNWRRRRRRPSRIWRSTLKSRAGGKKPRASTSRFSRSIRETTSRPPGSRRFARRQCPGERLPRPRPRPSVEGRGRGRARDRRPHPKRRGGRQRPTERSG
jgi:hypothetical protein